MLSAADEEPAVARAVVAEQALPEGAPKPVRQLRRVARWLLKPFVAVPGVADPFGSLRLYRVSVVRDLLKEMGDAPIVTRDGWAANVELLLRASRHARRIETVALQARYDLRPRESRVRPWADAMNLYRFGWAARRHRAGVTT